MSTVTTATAPTRPAGGRRLTRIRGVTLTGVLASEWIKLRSLRSTWVTLLCAVLALPGIGIITCYVYARRWDTMTPAARAGFDPTMHSIGGVYLAQLAIGVLGVLIISGEYSTGMIRATLIAVPLRLPVLWAKVSVYAAVTFLLMTAASLAAFAGGQAALGGHGTTLAAPQELRAVLGVPLYLTAIAALAAGLGFLLRSTAGGVATLVGLLLVLPLTAAYLPGSWSATISPYLPGNAGAAIYAVHPDPAGLGPWAGLAVLCGYTAVTLTAAAILLHRRDA